MVSLVCTVFVFVKQTTAYAMRISDWSSGVCSSDPTLPGFTLVNIPAGSRAAVHVPSPAGRPVKRWLFLTSGDLTLDVQGHDGASPAALRENGFLAWRDEAEAVSKDAVLTNGGCVAICIGHVLGDEPARTA